MTDFYSVYDSNGVFKRVNVAHIVTLTALDYTPEVAASLDKPYGVAMHLVTGAVIQFEFLSEKERQEFMSGF